MGARTATSDRTSRGSTSPRDSTASFKFQLQRTNEAEEARDAVPAISRRIISRFRSCFPIDWLRYSRRNPRPRRTVSNPGKFLIDDAFWCPRLTGLSVRTAFGLPPTTFAAIAKLSAKLLILLAGAPYGNRTRVTAVKGRCPGPLDEGRRAAPRGAGPEAAQHIGRFAAGGKQVSGINRSKAAPRPGPCLSCTVECAPK